MSTKNFKTMKALSKDELATKLRESESNLFKAKMQHKTGQLGDTAMLWRLKRDITWIKTIQGGAVAKTKTAPAAAAKGSK